MKGLVPRVFLFFIGYCLLSMPMAGLLPLGVAQNMDVSLMGKQDSTRREVEAKIKNEILDPIMGAGKSFVFADVEMEIIARKAEQTKEGIGILQKYKEKPGGGSTTSTDFLLPGVPKPKSVLGKDENTKRPEAAQGQQAQQAKGVEEIRWGIQTEINRFQVTVIYDDKISSATINIARGRVGEFLLPYKIKGKDEATVLFKPTKFKSYNIFDDLRRPSVYLPLLYALLLLLFLFFLFGPLWGFFRKYVKALVSKPGAEVNIDQKMEEGEGGGGGGGAGEGVQEGHQKIDMNFLQKEEEKEDEDDLMKKLEPFTYITEENLKRLIYLFLLRKEEPWVIAIVLSYMKPELARQALSMLPVEMQSKVAMESLTVKQATREQVKAIDKEIKDSVDFVMGGIENFTKMLEDSEPAIRKNILEYLKTQKPEIYEKVRRKILMFEDITGFPDKDVQLIIRSVSNEDIAKAVYKIDPQIMNKFFTNMSQGAVNAIKEIMEYAGDVSPGQVEDAQVKILDAIKSLDAEGKIHVRQESSQEVYIVDSDELSGGSQRMAKFQSISKKSAEPAAAVSPETAAQVGQYLSAGTDSYNQGRYEESLQYLEYAASLDPNQAAIQQYLGAAYYALGRADDAIRAYERYAQLSNDPAVTEWLNNFKQQAGK